VLRPPVTSQRRRRAWRPAAIAILAIVLAGFVPQAHAVEAPDDGLATGPWTASGIASGSATASVGAMEIVFNVDIPADFTFDIHSDGSADGTWEHGGSGTFTGTGEQGTVHGDLRYSGSGAVGGTNRELLLTGTSRTVGTVRAGGAGQTMAFPVDNTSPIPTLRMRVTAESCDEAYGEWAYTVEQAFEDEGFSATIGGHWLGFRESEAIKDHAEELFRLSTQTGSGAPPVSSESPLLATAANVIRRYNELADGLRAASLDEVFDILADSDAVVNTLRNLSDCEVELLGAANVETYLNGLTFVIQGLIAGGLDVFEVTSADWQLMVQVAARTGAIGAGAVDPAAAAQAEQALIDEGSAILAEHYLPERDTFEQTDDSVRVLATGAAMGWTYEVAGEPVNARATYRNAFGPAPEQP